MSTKVEKVLEFFKEHPNEIRECGVFNTRNTVGDPMTVLTTIDGITIETCYAYDYLEIFGFTNEEFEEFVDKYYELTK